MKPNTPEWYEWRNKGIGSSDAPVIMQTSSWKTPYKLWLEKTGRSIEEPRNLYILDKGHETERKARAIYEIMFDVKAPASFAIHDDFPFVRASLDGFVRSQNKCVEFKMHGKQNHELTQNGRVPPQYYWQVVHQLLASGATSCDFVSYCETAEQKMAVVNVKPKKKHLDLLLDKEQAFWNLVQTKKAPPFIDKDFKTVRVKGKTAEIRELEKVYAAYKLKLRSFFDGLPDSPRLILDGHKIFQGDEKYIEWKE